MGCQWNLYGSQLHKVLCAVFMIHALIYECYSLNLEGLALLKFRWKVDVDPNGVFADWNLRDGDPCNWSGVHCVDGRVEMLNLKELSLEGILAPDLGKLSHLRVLVLYKNNFSGIIPKEIGGLTMLELLDLRSNNLTGTIPAEIRELLSLKRLLLSDNKFEHHSSSWTEKWRIISDLDFDRNPSYDVATTEIAFLKRKVRNWYYCDYCDTYLTHDSEPSFGSFAGEITDRHLEQIEGCQGRKNWGLQVSFRRVYRKRKRKLGSSNLLGSFTRTRERIRILGHPTDHDSSNSHALSGKKHPPFPTAPYC